MPTNNKPTNKTTHIITAYGRTETLHQTSDTQHTINPTPQHPKVIITADDDKWTATFEGANQPSTKPHDTPQQAAKTLLDTHTR